MTKTSPYTALMQQLTSIQEQLESTTVQQALESDQETLGDICDQLAIVTANKTHSEDALAISQDTLCRLITHFPRLTPIIPRELLWQLGGECLHYLGDEEIIQFQAIEDLLQEAEANGQTLSREDVRAKVFKLH